MLFDVLFFMDFRKILLNFQNNSKMTTATIVSGSKLRLNSYLINKNIEDFTIKNFRERFLIPTKSTITGGFLTVKIGNWQELTGKNPDTF